MPTEAPHRADLGPLAVTILGSGSPIPTSRRVSSSAIVWIDGRPSILIDAGGGTFERFGRLGVDPADLDVVLVTHTHIDHSGGLAPMVFAGWMSGRDRPLSVVGPSGRHQHPGVERFCDLLFGPNGAWSYLHTFDGFAIAPIEVAADPGTWTPTAWRSSRTTVSAVGVPHGMMPSLAYRIDHAGRSICFTGDLEGADEGLIALAADVDLLVHDQALPTRDIEHGDLHPPPEHTAANAARCRAAHLLLTHWMPPGDADKAVIVDRIRSRYNGGVSVARGLLTVPVAPEGAGR